MAKGRDRDPDLERVDGEIAKLKELSRAGGGPDPGGVLAGLRDNQQERKIIMADLQLPRTAAPWLRENYQPDDKIAIVMIGPKGHTIQRIDTVENFAGDRYQKWFRAQNAMGYNIHVSMSALKPEATSRTKGDVSNVRHLYLDLDHGGRPALDKILNSPDVPKPSSVIESSPDKFQLHWRAEQFTPEKAERLMKNLANEFGGDRAATDVARVMRLPGFVNRKEDYRADPPLARLVSSDKSPAVRPQSFPERFYREVERPRMVREEEHPRGQQRAKEGPDRSAADWRWVMQSLERGVDPGSIRATLEQNRQDKPNPRYYAEHTVERAVERFEQQHHHKHPEHPGAQERTL